MNVAEKKINTLKSFLFRDKGVVSIEFSMVAGLFFLMVFFIFEISRYLFIAAAIDFTLATAARTSSITSDYNVNYQTLFGQLVKNENALLAGMINPQDIKVRVQYCESLTLAARGSCTANKSSGKALALYYIDYEYQPLIVGNMLPGTRDLIEVLKNSLSRRLFYIQEYERDGK